MKEASTGSDPIRPISLRAFAGFSHNFVLAAALPAVWLAGLWLRVIPSYRIQRGEIGAMIIVSGAFQLAYLHSVRTVITRWLGRGLVTGRVPKGASAAFLWAPSPILLMLGLFLLWHYTLLLNDSLTVERARSIAHNEQEVDHDAAAFMTLISGEPARHDIVPAARKFILQVESRAPTASEVRENAETPIAFAWDLLLLAAGMTLCVALSFGWMASVEYMTEVQAATARRRKAGSVIERETGPEGQGKSTSSAWRSGADACPGLEASGSSIAILDIRTRGAGKPHCGKSSAESFRPSLEDWEDL